VNLSPCIPSGARYAYLADAPLRAAADRITSEIATALNGRPLAEVLPTMPELPCRRPPRPSRELRRQSPGFTASRTPPTLPGDARDRRGGAGERPLGGQQAGLPSAQDSLT
jgi:hypothetical protein